VPRQSPYYVRWLASAQATGQETRATTVAVLRPMARQRPGHGSGDPCHDSRRTTSDGSTAPRPRVRRPVPRHSQNVDVKPGRSEDDEGDR
jgi:hypothetical protein